MPLLRCLQTLTAAAALFAILGACGLAPAPIPTRPIVRPHQPRAEVTVRSLTGTWVGVWQTPDGLESLVLSVVQSGDALSGTLIVRGWPLKSDPTQSARLDATGRFALELGQPREVVVRGQPDATGDGISASITGLSAHPVAVRFRRQ